jgi:hypothetical protein
MLIGLHLVSAGDSVVSLRVFTLTEETNDDRGAFWTDFAVFENVRTEMRNSGHRTCVMALLHLGITISLIRWGDSHHQSLLLDSSRMIDAGDIHFSYC